jgi:hypothetical protein
VAKVKVVQEVGIDQRQKSGVERYYWADDEFEQ